jgi:hypothetical protein
MKRSWKLSIEVGGSEQKPPSLVQSPNRDAAWNLLVESRRALAQSVESNQVSPELVESANQWTGGGLAVLAAMTGDDPEVLRQRLMAEVPIKTSSNFYHAERSRPRPHPGAQKSLDVSTLTDEEREELGIVLPQQLEADDFTS